MDEANYTSYQHGSACVHCWKPSFSTQLAQAHVSRKSQRLIHEIVTRCVTWLPGEEPLKIRIRYILVVVTLALLPMGK